MTEAITVGNKLVFTFDGEFKNATFLQIIRLDLVQHLFKSFFLNLY